MKTAVVTDSNSGIFGEEARSLGIHVIPMPIIIDDQTFFENEDIMKEHKIKDFEELKMIVNNYIYKD